MIILNTYNMRPICLATVVGDVPMMMKLVTIYNRINLKLSVTAHSGDHVVLWLLAINFKMVKLTIHGLDSN